MGLSLNGNHQSHIVQVFTLKWEGERLNMYLGFLRMRGSFSGSLDDSVKVEKIFNEFKTLYNELLTFKDKTDFKKSGFGAGGPYNDWLKRVEKLENDPDSDLLLKKGVLVGELQQLGMAYVGSKGKETEVTREFNKTFKDAILSKPVENVETKSGNTNYKKIQADYELFGRWKIKNSTIN